MKQCGWCGKSITKGYSNNTNHVICLDCAEENLNKMIELRDNVNKEIIILATGIRKLKRDLCLHENIYDTGYCRWSDRLRPIYRCNDCGKEILKD